MQVDGDRDCQNKHTHTVQDVRYWGSGILERKEGKKIEIKCTGFLFRVKAQWLETEER